MSDRREPVVVFVNESARRAHPASWRRALARFEPYVSVIVETPSSAKAMEQRMRDVAAEGACRVVVAGGDGSVNLAVNALAGTGTPLGVIPIGTGNDFARALGIPADPAEAAACLVDAVPRAMDVVEANGRLFATAGLLGVPADSALTVRRWGAPQARTRGVVNLIGGLTYTLAGARQILAPALRPRIYDVDVDGDRVRLEGHGVFVTNTAVIGGGLVVPVGADHADGRMEVTVIRPMPRWRLAQAFVAFASGAALPAGSLETRVGRTAVVTCEGLQAFSADGDLMARATIFTLRVRPGALLVLR